MTSMCYLLGIYYSQIVKFVSFGFEIETRPGKGKKVQQHSKH